MTTEDLNKIKDFLPKDWAKTIAIKVSKSEDYVRKVMRGVRNDDKIIDEALLLVAQARKEEQKRKQLIESL